MQNLFIFSRYFLYTILGTFMTLCVVKVMENGTSRSVFEEGKLFLLRVRGAFFPKRRPRRGPIEV